MQRLPLRLAVLFVVVAAGVGAIVFPAASDEPHDAPTSPAPESASRGPGPLTLTSKLERLQHDAVPGLPPRQTMVTVGHSALGRPIRLRAYGYPRRFDGHRAYIKTLVFGCIHGTECAASSIRPVGCPVEDRAFVVPNLNPDGLALATRLNARGVDLNRNFPSEWKPIGARGGPEYSGPRPFSEPETRLAARLIRVLRPDITIWFHQEQVPMVRAWGPSVPAARHYARLVHLPFRHLPWLAGTAPNWQNHRFPHSSSFVVELPPGPVSRVMAGRLANALKRVG